MNNPRCFRTRATSLPLVLVLAAWWVLAEAAPGYGEPGEVLPGTQRLTWQGDLAARLVEGADRFLLRKTDDMARSRRASWQAASGTEEAFAQFRAARRQDLQWMLGTTDVRPPYAAPLQTSPVGDSATVAASSTFSLIRIHWPSLDGIDGDGILLEPAGERRGNVVLIPDAELSPEAWLAHPPAAAHCPAYDLVQQGYRVVVMRLLGRTVRPRRNVTLTDREFIYRSAFELGRHPIGFETQKVLALIDWMDRDERSGPLAVVGWGEGGMLALYAAALDERIDVTCVSGYFGPRESMWQEPVDRNVMGRLQHFGDAELAAMIAPRRLIVETAAGPTATIRTQGGAPGKLIPVDPQRARAEATRAAGLVPFPHWSVVVTPEEGHPPGPAFGAETVPRILAAFAAVAGTRTDDEPSTPGPLRDRDSETLAKLVAPTESQQRIVQQFDRYNQRLLARSPYVRKQYTRHLDTSSLPAFQQSQSNYRADFAERAIGQFDDPRLAPRPRTRRVYETKNWTGYEVVLDVYPEVFAFGILLLPKNIAPGEKRPVVVCQHGLEGRPRHTIEGDHPAYHNFAARLADRGFITFAPQNLYIFGDRFRSLQRKANPIGKTLFSIIVPQHKQLTDWLATLPQVDAERIGFYGLSYGGKSAMRIPPLVDRYCLSICSADFNDWVWKNASTLSPYSYVWTGEYEIFEFDLGSTFNYSEMAALIAPRPFMVERGHFDGVAPDERVAYEFAKVRHLYQAKLGIGDRCEIEWFVGPHTINGQGTFRFLHRHLRWPEPTGN